MRRAVVGSGGSQRDIGGLCGDLGIGETHAGRGLSARGGERSIIRYCVCFAFQVGVVEFFHFHALGGESIEFGLVGPRGSFPHIGQGL